MPAPEDLEQYATVVPVEKKEIEKFLKAFNGDYWIKKLLEDELRCLNQKESRQLKKTQRSFAA